MNLKTCILSVFSVLLASCASMGKKANLPKSVVLEFKGKTGEVSYARYYSNARILTYEDQQLVRDRYEGVDFTVKTHTTDYDPEKKIVKYDSTTVEKDGTVDLHDLAFPELNEQLDYVVRGNGEVLKVGRFPPQSLFFVPSLPIPNHPVEIGETWDMSHTWFSAKDSIPLQLDVVGILKDIVSCEGGHVCVDLEISGHVNLVREPTTIGSRFGSRLWGRLLFSLDRGDVIWSEMRSEEEMGVPGHHMKVRSCMVSETKISSAYKTKFECDPDQDAILRTPEL